MQVWSKVQVIINGIENFTFSVKRETKLCRGLKEKSVILPFCKKRERAVASAHPLTLPGQHNPTLHPLRIFQLKYTILLRGSLCDFLTQSNSRSKNKKGKL